MTAGIRNSEHPHILKILELWNAGKSASQIGEVIGLERNAIIGIVWRGRGKGHPFIDRRQKTETKKAQKGRVRRKSVKPGRVLMQTTADPRIHRSYAKVFEPYVAPAPPADLLPSLDLDAFGDHDGCKWPTTTGCCCGHPKTLRRKNEYGFRITGVYCDAHTNMASAEPRRYKKPDDYANAAQNYTLSPTTHRLG